MLMMVIIIIIVIIVIIVNIIVIMFLLEEFAFFPTFAITKIKQVFKKVHFECAPFRFYC